MTKPTYEFLIDWDNDGTFVDAGEDVTARTLGRSPVGIQYGRDQARSLSPIQAGQANLELDNRSKDYSPEYASSPLAGNLKPGRQVVISANHLSTDYVLYRGFLDDFVLLPGIEDRAVQFTALDALGRLRGETISTALLPGITTGTAVGLILDAIGWPALDRDIDAGITTIPYWWEEGTDALDALAKLVDAEGPSALVAVDADGKFVFRDRHHRLLRSASLTSQATFRDTGAEPKFSGPLTYDLGWRDVVNSVTFTIEERVPDAERSTIWTAGTAGYLLAAGSTLEVTVQADEPFQSAKTPVAGEDYTALTLSGTHTVALSRTSGQSTTIIFTHTGGTSVNIRGLRLVARPVRAGSTVQVHREDAASIAEYGRRAYPKGDAGWAGENDAVAVAELILAQYAERLPTVAMRVVSANDTRTTQQLSRDLSDRITIVEAQTDLNDAFFIEQIQHSITDAGEFHETIFGCEKVNPNPPDDPSTMFRFSTSGQGFNQGLFAH